VLDFGLSRLKRAQSHSRQDHLAGTPAYLAPERAVGSPPDDASDQYALGVLFYETLTGEVPFDGNVAQILNAHINTPPTPPSWRLPKGELNEGFDDLILTCLAKDPTARFASVRVFLDELTALMERLGMTRRRRETPVVHPAQPTGGDASCRAMVESNPLPMFAVDPDGLITMVNQSFCLFVKKKEKELVGVPLAETRLTTFAPGLPEDLMLVVKKNKVTSRELEFSTKGEGSKVLIWLAPLTLGGFIMGAHGIVHWIHK
jgi:serine/threonine protein kinase